MRAREISRLPSDDHPYRTGAWKPNLVEYDADERAVVERLRSGVDLRANFGTHRELATSRARH